MSYYYNKDLYKILEIDFEASEEDIKSAYRKLVRKYHPDVATSEADTEKFKEIQEAYEVLSDSEKRKKYDVVNGYYREKIKKEYTKSQTKNAYEETIKKAKKHTTENVNFSQSINDALDSLFHNVKQPDIKESKIPVNGKDINLDISLSCFEAINGTTRKVNILHTEPCSNCEGRTFINGAECNMCHGTGQISIQKKINVKIPKGVSQDSKIRIKKEGNKGLNGGKDGDLYLIVKIDKNPYYDIDGLNIICNLPITPYEAALGTEIPLKISGNDVVIKIPALTSSGQKFTLSGQGLSNKTKTKKGDIIVTVTIKLPKELTEAEIKLYEELKNISNNEIRKEFHETK